MRENGYQYIGIVKDSKKRFFFCAFCILVEKTPLPRLFASGSWKGLLEAGSLAPLARGLVIKCR